MTSTDNLLVFHILGIVGELCVLQGRQKWTVSTVRLEIERTLGIPVAEQRLLHGLKELTAHKDFSDIQDAAINLTLLRRTAEQGKWLQKLSNVAWLQAAETFRDAPLEVRSDREIALTAIGIDARAMEYVGALKKDREFVLAALARNGESISFVDERFRHDKEAALIAAGNAGQALRHVSPALRADRDVVIAASKQTGWALQFAAKQARSDRELMRVAVGADSRAMQFAAPEIQSELMCFLEDDLQVVLGHSWE